MDDDERAQTHRVWEADLSDQGRKLTLRELAALEAMHQCQSLQTMSTRLLFLLDHTRSLEGKVDRLEQYIRAVDKRYPRADGPDVDLVLVDANGR